MQAAGVGHRRAIGVFDLDGDFQRALAQPIFDGQAESEGIERAGVGVVAQGQPRGAVAARLERESLRGGEAVQPQRIMAPFDPRPVARPADDREQDRADLAPDRRIARPQKVAPADPPGARFGAGQRDLGARPVAFEGYQIGHGFKPLIAAASTSAAFTPGAQAISGLPLVKPSPARKSLT